jgi:hypothetical protein
MNELREAVPLKVALLKRRKRLVVNNVLKGVFRIFLLLCGGGLNIGSKYSANLNILAKMDSDPEDAEISTDSEVFALE